MKEAKAEKKTLFDKLGDGLAKLKGEGFEQEPAFRKKVGDHVVTVRKDEETTGGYDGKPKKTTTWFRVDLSTDYGMVPCGGDEAPKPSFSAHARCADGDKAMKLAAALSSLLSEYGFAEATEKKDEPEKES